MESPSITTKIHPMTAGRGKNKISSEKAANEIVEAIKGRRDEIFIGKTNLLHWVSRLSPGMARRKMKRLGVMSQTYIAIEEGQSLHSVIESLVFDKLIDFI